MPLGMAETREGQPGIAAAALLAFPKG